MTHPNDPTLRSFISIDPTSDFPIQNLPYGVFSARDGLAPRVGVAIGECVLDLWELEQDRRLDNDEVRRRARVAMADVKLHLPIAVAGYTDFYSSKEHAPNVGTMFRDKTNPLLPNWLHIPIGYNGRASTVVVSGTKFRRPRGQLKPPNAELPGFGPCKRLDFELEMGVVIGQPSPIAQMLNDSPAEPIIFRFPLLTH